MFAFCRRISIERVARKRGKSEQKKFNKFNFSGTFVCGSKWQLRKPFRYFSGYFEFKRAKEFSHFLLSPNRTSVHQTFLARFTGRRWNEKVLKGRARHQNQIAFFSNLISNVCCNESATLSYMFGIGWVTLTCMVYWIVVFCVLPMENKLKTKIRISGMVTDEFDR